MEREDDAGHREGLLTVLIWYYHYQHHNSTLSMLYARKHKLGDKDDLPWLHK